MARFHQMVWSPAGHLTHQSLVTVILLVAWSAANSLPASVSRIPQTATTADLPYGNRYEEGHVTSTPGTTMETSGYEYYLSQEESDLGSDPSTWKLLPIQIPDDLVSNAILKEEEEEDVTSSTSPPYPTFHTPQYLKHPGTTEHQPLVNHERFHHSFNKGLVTSKPQHQTWDHHSRKSSPETPEPQHQTWDRHSIKSSPKSPEPHHQTWNRHSSKNNPGNPEPQHQTWDRHSSKSSSGSSETQHQTWDHHSSKSSHESPTPQLQTWDHHSINNSPGSQEPQHHTWNRHSSKISSGSLETQHQARDHHSSKSSHVSPTPQHHSWDRHSLDRGAHHGSRPSRLHYHNWTHTSDGYDIRNHHEEEQLGHHTPAIYPNSKHLQHPMPPRPSVRNRKPPNAPSWQQNIMERLSQHLPKLPAFPSFNFLGFGNLPSLPRMPPWASKKRLDQIQVQDLPQLEGEYVHKFYPLISKNDPLQHLNSNRDRHYKPHYTYPPHQGHTNQDDALDIDQSIDKFPEYQSEHPPVDSGDGYSAQHLTETTLHYDAHDDGHHTEEEDHPQVSQQDPHASHHLPLYPHHTRPDPRRPFHKHARPQRILRVQQHQVHKEQSDHHHIPPNTHSWAWEEQQEPPSPAHHPLRDPYNRRPSSDQNWIYQAAENPSGDYQASSSSFGDHHHHTSHTYSSHALRPYDHGSSYGDSQHLQQQGLGSSWNSESQQGLSVAYNSILDPLSNLLSRPSSPSFIGPSPYEQSIIERITGVDASSTTSLVIPGGLLVLGLALALFYFNFVWYPTPVVTAKIFKMLSDGTLSQGQQRTVGEVYQVFRGLEAEYRHDQSVSSTSCRSRLVCQVHQELPGLWKVTQAYAAFVKSSLVSGPEGDSEFSDYQEAARRGSEGEDCSTHYSKCGLPPVPVKAILRKLVALLHTA